MVVMSDAKIWQELSRKRVFDSYRKIDEVVYRLPDETNKTFQIKMEGEVICGLPLTVNNEVILAEQYRPGPGKTLLELPGGGLERGELPAEGMARELLEETGYAGTVQYVTDSQDDAYSSVKRHCFVITGCKKVTEQKLDHGEFVNVRLVSLERFREILRSGQMTDVEVGYLGLDFLGLL
jgi:ADP-ribose pyrophosphatase